MCETCGQLLTVSTLLYNPQRTHRDCRPRQLGYLDQLELAFLAAVLAGNAAAANALEVTLDRANHAPESLLEAALAYAAWGWPVFPCKPGDKVPATPNGFLDATTNPEVIARWWAHEPRRNVGVPTGLSFDVIDYDLTEGPEVLNEWVRLQDNRDAECDGLVSTPRGFHCYVARLNQVGQVGVTAGNKAKIKVSGQRISGVDYRGKGGYVVVPPSVRPNGRYRWWVKPSPRIVPNVTVA